EARFRESRIVAGLVISLPRDWRLSVDMSWGANRNSNAFPAFRFGLAAAEIASGEIDVLKDTNLAPVDFKQYAGTLPASLNSSTTATLRNPALRLGGPVPVHLPGGSPSIAFGIEHR